MGSVFYALMTPTLRRRKQSSSLPSMTWWPGWVWAGQGLERKNWRSAGLSVGYGLPLGVPGLLLIPSFSAPGYSPYKVTYASDYFDQLYAWAVELIHR